MSKELEKNYNPSEIEDRLYHKWLEKKYFHAEVNRDKKPFTIVMPPPNITGKLHMGHALDNTMQDIIIRFKRMQGYEALWIPGTDHASISTEVKVTNALKEEGIDKHELGREGFLKRTWEWKKEYGGTITSQLKKIGSSCDWDRERFTMDEGCSKAVQEVFIKLYEKGLIYKGSRIVNWCPVCNTSISDAEVEHEEQAGHFWHINYPVVGEPGRYVEIATTRPETLLGDSALAVNPDDERYTDLVGKEVELPLTDRTIPIIADPYVDKEFGTGVVKITPAHDPNDFEVGKRHNLPEINILNDDATINNLGGKYAGMDRYEARKAMVADLDALGLLVRVEDHTHNVGTHDRCKTTVEPMIKQQWFVKMDELIKPAVEGVKKGDIELIPASMDKTYYNWTDNIRDWCISRQLWWGHRIPAYYCKDCGEMTVSRDKVCTCPKCGSANVEQDPDTLDTWFSSALWPFSTLGWPENTADLERYFPNDVLVTGYDIIFFWVARMAFQTRYCMKNRPFKDVLIHGLVRDTQGRKMSKSLGNGIDPMDVIQEKGADALRFFLTTNSTPGQDLRFDETKMDASWNFINKIWNAARYVQMQIGDTKPELDMTKANSVDKWILARFNEVLDHVSTNMDKYELAIVGNELYSFVWDDFCSWYIELSKATLYSEDESLVANTKAVLYTVMMGILKVLSPFMPFVTEEIYLNLPHEKESLNVETWPEKVEFEYTDAEKDEMALVISAIQTVREIKVEYAMKPSEDLIISLHNDNGYVALNTESTAILARMAHATVKEDLNTEDVLSRTIEKAVLTVAMDALIDLEEEKGKLEKEIARLENEIKRCSGMLKNPGFVNKAPEAKVNAEKEKLASYTEKLEMTKTQLDNILKKLG